MSEVAKAALRRQGAARIVAVAVAAVLAVAALGWYCWLWFATPVPPVVPLNGVEPAVAQAVELARAKVRQNGRSALAWGELGKVLRAHEFFEPSNLCFAQAERFDPSEPHWPYYQGLNRLLTNPDAAVPFFRRAVALSDRRGQDSDGLRLRLADALLQIGEDKEAEEQCRRVLERDPHNVQAHYDLGVAAVRRSDSPAAIEHLTISAKSPFARQKSSSQLAVLNQRLGDAAGAAEYTRQANLQPADLIWEDPYLTEIMQLDVGRRGRLMDAEQLENQGRDDMALEILHGLADEWEDARPRIEAGRLLFKHGQLDQAEQLFREAVHLETNGAEAHYSLAVALYLQGRRLADSGDGEGARKKYREALENADGALELKPDHAQAHLYRGLALKALNQRKEAVEALQRAVLCRPELIDPHWELANALDDDGRENEAKAEFRRVVELAQADDPRRAQALMRSGGDAKR